MKNEAMYVSNARSVLKSFVPYITDRNNKYSLMNSVNRFNMDFPQMRANLKSGASRSTVIFDDFVVKFDTGDPYYGDTLSEYKGYRLALANGMDRFFAPLVKIKVEHHYYYIMKKISTLAVEEWEYEGEGWGDAIRSFDSGVCDDDVDWVFDEFNDLHDENYGFTDDGEMLIIDYACNKFRNPNRCHR